jgi:hypothetical protein
MLWGKWILSLSLLEHHFWKVCLLNTWCTVVNYIARCKARNFRSYTKRMYVLLHKPYVCAPTQTVRMCYYTNRRHVLLNKLYVCAPIQTVRMCSYIKRTYVLLHKPYACAPTQTVRMCSHSHCMYALRMIVMIKQRLLCSIFNNCAPVSPDHK